MNAKQYIALGTAVILLGAGAYYSQLLFLSSTQGVSLTELDAESKKSAGIDFSLSVGEHLYRGYVPSGSTILDAMNTLASSTDFRFTTKEFPGLGAFVESVNGKANADGFYWILYVNGKISNSGASDSIVKYGDTVEWRYEKGY